MYRHSPNRHQKSKGFRLKHVLQICVLVAVCFWLIYQVKHSHDKRKQFDENDAKSSRDVEMHNAVLKLGRKDLNPQEKGPNKDLESHDEETEEEIVEEDKNGEVDGEQDKTEEEIDLEDKHEEQIEEEDKHEEETGEEDKDEEETGEDKDEKTGEEDKNEEETGEDKHEEETGEEDKLEEENGVEDKHEKEEQEEDTETEKKGEEGTGGGDDGVNEQEQEKTESGNHQEEEFIEEKKDKEDTDEEESEDKDDDNKDSRQKNESSIEDHDHDEGSKITREAREEQYKGDDASSAVTHDGQITSAENVVGNMENQTSAENVVGNMENQASTEEHKNKHNNTKVGNAGQNTIDVNNVHEVEAAENGNLTSNEEKSSNGQSEMINNTDPQDSSIKNETEIIMSDMIHSHSVTDGNVTAAEGVNVETLALEQPDNSTGALENTKLDSNSSSVTATKNVEENPEESRDSSTNSEFVSSENLAQSSVLAENKDGFGSTTTVKSTDKVGNENPENVEGTEGTYENSDPSTTEDTDEVQHDSIDSSDSSVPVDDEENPVDLDTLPDIRTEGSNSEEVAEE